MRRSSKGFTFTEIMIVVAIIGLLVSVAVPAFIKSRERARMGACHENLIQIDQAIQQYVIMENYLGDAQLTIPLSYLVGNNTYLRSLPICPAGGTYELHTADAEESVTCSIGHRPNFPHALPWTIEGFGTPPPGSGT